MAGAFFPYFYELGRTTREFIRASSWPLSSSRARYTSARPSRPPRGPSPFAAAYAWERRTVFSRYAVPALLVYAGVVARLFGAGIGTLPHVIAGLLAWLVVRFLPAGRPLAAADAPASTTMIGLGLLDPPGAGEEKGEP